MICDRLAAILECHSAWARDGEPEGDSRRANLEDADLRGADLRGADLKGADLKGAVLWDADLKGADLRGADLKGAVLWGADLRGAVLKGADLRGAVLRDAVLRGADLWCADLKGADLRDADLGDVLPNWSSHTLVAEFLLRAAGDDVEKRKVAGLVLVSSDWCWGDFGCECGGDPLWGWALDTLAAHVRESDGAPEILRKRATRRIAGA